MIFGVNNCVMLRISFLLSANVTLDALGQFCELKTIKQLDWNHRHVLKKSVL